MSELQKRTAPCSCMGYDCQCGNTEDAVSVGYTRGWNDALDAQAQEIAALRARLADAKRDAERYRWLRDSGWHIHHHDTKGGRRWGVSRNAVSEYEMQRDLDATIDAARGGAS